MRIRNVDIGNGLTLAPMAGVTDRTFRMLCRRQGADYVVSEMISAKAIAYGDRKTPELARLGEDVRIVSRVGGDFLGQMLTTLLSQNGVDTRYVARDEHAETTAAILMLGPDGVTTISARHSGAWLLPQSTSDSTCAAKSICAS